MATELWQGNLGSDSDSKKWSAYYILNTLNKNASMEYLLYIKHPAKWFMVIIPVEPHGNTIVPVPTEC